MKTKMPKEMKEKIEIKETYDAYVKCLNCFFENSSPAIKIPKGTRTEDYPCPKCGCKTLRKN